MSRVMNLEPGPFFLYRSFLSIWPALLIVLPLVMIFISLAQTTKGTLLTTSSTKTLIGIVFVIYTLTNILFIFFFRRIFNPQLLNVSFVFWAFVWVLCVFINGGMIRDPQLRDRLDVASYISILAILCTLACRSATIVCKLIMR
jgi:hypothetical protein